MKRINNFIYLGVVMLSLGLFSCNLSRPFGGPGYSNKTVTLPIDGDSVTVSLTYMELGSDGKLNDLFWKYVGKVEKTLPEFEGFIGYSIRRDLLGKKGWTMTVWKNDDAMRSFASSSMHLEAIRETGGAFANAKFATFQVNKKDIPLDWEQAESILEKQGRGYY